MNPAIVGQECGAGGGPGRVDRHPGGYPGAGARETGVGPGYPYSNEKLGLILALYVEPDEEAALRRCVEILEWEGAGHTFSIHAEDENVVKKFAAAVPASRVLVNTPSSLGGIGASTCLFPALTLGCGAVGGSSSSNNIGPLDLINIKRVAWGVKELEDLRGGQACRADAGTRGTVDARRHGRAGAPDHEEAERMSEVNADGVLLNPQEHLLQEVQNLTNSLMAAKPAGAEGEESWSTR